MTVNLPIAGEEPWDAKLNAAITGIDTRVATLEGAPPGLVGGGGGGGTDTTGAWFNGKQWYAMGTSLTIQGFYTAPLAALSGMVLHNLGQSAQSLSQTPTGGSGAMWDAMISQTGTDAEVITMETTNDWRLSATLGSITDAEDHQLSFYGALKGACAWILTHRPAARFFLITNYNDSYPPGTFGNFYNPNNLGKFQWEYNEAVRKVAEVYGVPLIDMARDSGLNYWTSSYFTSDGLHMNTLGGTRFAEYAWSRMRTLGWETTRPTAPGGIVNVAVTGVDIVQGSAIALAPGDTQQLSATISPSNASNKGMSWSSGTPAVATVNGLGLLTAVANGTSIVTVTTTDGGITDTITVTVAVAVVTGVDVQPPTATITATQTAQLTAAVQPSNAGNKNVTWQSSAPSKATVSASGLVTGVATGTATITATTAQGGFTDTCAVTVAAAVSPTGVSVLPATASASVGSTVQLTATVAPSNATNKAVTWSSSVPSIASVNSSGLVTGVATGTCLITATTQVGGLTSTCAITVPASGWTMRKASLYHGIGMTVSNDGNNDPVCTSQWPFPAIICNDYVAGDNAIEFGIASGTDCWIVPGSNGTDTTFGAFGAIGNGSTLEVTPTSAGLGSTVGRGGYTLCNALGSMVAGVTKIRAARVGKIVTVWQWDGSNWVKFIEVNLATQSPGFANQTVIQSPMLGILYGTSQATINNVWTGTYVP